MQNFRSDLLVDWTAVVLLDRLAEGYLVRLLQHAELIACVSWRRGRHHPDSSDASEPAAKEAGGDGFPCIHKKDLDLALALGMNKVEEN
jgi:hypothetical protein